MRHYKLELLGWNSPIVEVNVTGNISGRSAYRYFEYCTGEEVNSWWDDSHPDYYNIGVRKTYNFRGCDIERYFKERCPICKNHNSHSWWCSDNIEVRQGEV